MNICHILTYSYENGGTSKFVFELAKCQLERGDKVKILSTDLPGHSAYPVPEGAELLSFNPNLLTKILPLYSKDLRDYIAKNREEIDAIHLHCLWNDGELLVHQMKLHSKCVVTVHGSLHEYTFGGLTYYKRWLFSELFQKNFLKKIKAIHVNHADEEQDVVKYLGFLPEQTEIIPNGMDGGEFENIDPFSRNRNQLLYIGRLHHKKGFDILMPAFKKVVEKNAAAQLLIAGPDDGMLSFIKDFTKENHLENHVKILGTVTGEAKKELLRKAGVFVLPTHSEGFSLAAMEALNYALPMVVSDQTGLSPMLENYGAAVVPDLNPDDFARGILKVLEDDKLYKNLPQNGKKLIDEKLDKSIVCKEFNLKIYDKFR